MSGTWTSEDLGDVQPLCVLAVDANHVYVGGIHEEDGGAIQVRDSDGNYTEETGFSMGYIEMLFSRRSDQLFATGSYGLTPGATWPIATSDGGGTWVDGVIDVDPPGGLASYFLSGFGGVPAGDLYALFTDNGGGTYSAFVMKSTNSGNTWTQVSALDAVLPTTVEQPYKINFSSTSLYAHSVRGDANDNIWFCLHRSVVHWNGSAWSIHELASDFNTMGLWVSGATVYVVGQSDDASGGDPTIAGYYTTTGGGSWTAFSLPTNQGVGDTAIGAYNGDVFGFTADSVVVVANGYGGSGGSSDRVFVGATDTWTPEGDSIPVEDTSDVSGVDGLPDTGDVFVVKAGNHLVHGAGVSAGSDDSPARVRAVPVTPMGGGGGFGVD